MDAPGMNFKPKGLYIGGHWGPSMGDRTFTTINPSTSETLGEVPYATEEDVDRAVQAAKQAFPGWSRLSSKERAQSLELLAKRIDENSEELATMDSYDGGSAIAGMRGDMAWTVSSLKFFAGLVSEIKGETSSQEGRHLNLTRRQPFGVVAKINAFNHPFRFCAEKASSHRAWSTSLLVTQ